MKNLKWRLSKLPTPDEVRELVKDKIITQDEAREILFSQETEEDVTTAKSEESLKAEIKFLRELVNKMSTRSTIEETIKYIEKPYQHWGWYQPYQFYCGTNGALNSINTTALNLTGGTQTYLANTSTGATYGYNSTTGEFTDISTF